MDDLPIPLISDILNRLDDSADLARCRLASKTLNSLSYDVRSLTIICTLSRYLKSRSPETRDSMTPFKSICKAMVSRSRGVERVWIGVEKSLAGISYDDVEDESDDMHLTDVRFLEEWLPNVAGELKELTMSDFWIQSCWRRSEALALVSSCCNNLTSLELKNAWLSVDGLKVMPNLTSLTLEFIRLDDEDLQKVNDSFPCLEVLNLIGVGGLKEPRVHLLHLRICQWAVSNAPTSLTILAPKLEQLKLTCVKPGSLILECPILNDFQLYVESTDNFKVAKFLNLENLHLESSNLSTLVGMFAVGETIKSLTVDSVKRTGCVEMAKCSFETLFDVFPNVRCLRLGPGAWSEVESCFHLGGLVSRTGMGELNEIVALLVVHDIEETLLFISSIVRMCTKLSDVSLLVPRELDSTLGSNLISKCRATFSRIRWKWGTWKEGTEDIWSVDVV